MTDPNDTLNEFLEALRTGKGNPRFVALGQAFAAAEAKRKVQPDELEARDWLAATTSSMPLAANHFSTRSEAEAFVNRLYSLGAALVIATNISYEGAGTQDSYSASLVVTMPQAHEERKAVIDFCNQHCMADSATGARFIDEGQSALSLWWD